jgi:hypothetical protein
MKHAIQMQLEETVYIGETIPTSSTKTCPGFCRLEGAEQVAIILLCAKISVELASV